jgi:hypothetical protein
VSITDLNEDFYYRLYPDSFSDCIPISEPPKFIVLFAQLNFQESEILAVSIIIIIIIIIIIKRTSWSYSGGTVRSLV